MTDIAPTAQVILTDAAKAAAQLSVDASITAQEVLATAAEAASHEAQRQSVERENMKEVLVDALNKVFGEKEEAQQFINVSRIPMICSQISNIHKNIEEITFMLNELKLVKKIVYGICSLVGTFVVIALLTLIIKR